MERGNGVALTKEELKEIPFQPSLISITLWESFPDNKRSQSAPDNGGADGEKPSWQSSNGGLMSSNINLINYLAWGRLMGRK